MLFYGRHRFFGRVAWSYTDEAIKILRSEILNDRYRVPRDQVDVQLR
ncbi:MAG: hypothetical protein JNG83_14345 [Opitutaceae bacterium]|nr:hypothetical protein [Opitutaceae bacterium]